MKLKVDPPQKGKKLYDVPIEVVVPSSALAFLPEGDATKASVEIYVGAIDDRGATSDIGRDIATFTRPKDASGESALTRCLTLQTKKGNYKIVVNVRDVATGKIGTAKASIRVE